MDASRADWSRTHEYCPRLSPLQILSLLGFFTSAPHLTSRLTSHRPSGLASLFQHRHLHSTPPPPLPSNLSSPGFRIKYRRGEGSQRCEEPEEHESDRGRSQLRAAVTMSPSTRRLKWINHSRLKSNAFAHECTHTD
ncbi:unnamed protein product [Pleuronectes platessa]|uniref:Uncharacterized protein n=1 Tax=Pleuronectes platessa TaxID=8262 RepID=A0A9N7VJJ9_PLEPL|nr:unnamed protein product [Pleuronectes platessa]